MAYKIRICLFLPLKQSTNTLQHMRNLIEETRVKIGFYYSRNVLIGSYLIPENFDWKRMTVYLEKIYTRDTPLVL